MDAKELQVKHNDFAVAKTLNEYVARLILMVALGGSIGVIEGDSDTDLNRAYVLLSDELHQLYERNPELNMIEPIPIWKRFDVLDAASW